jgi:hypothetical protein
MMAAELKQRQNLWTQGHRLIKRVVRTYYSREQVFVMDTLLRLLNEHPQAQSFDYKKAEVPELTMEDKCMIGKKQVKFILMQFARDHLLVTSARQQDKALYMAQREKEGLVGPLQEYEKKKMKRKFVYYRLDFVHMVLAIKFRHSEMVEVASDGSSGNQDALYYCARPECMNAGKEFKMMDLIQGSRAGATNMFTCRVCKQVDPRLTDRQLQMVYIDPSLTNKDFKALVNEKLGSLYEDVNAFFYKVKQDLAERNSKDVHQSFNGDYSEEDEHNYGSMELSAERKLEQMIPLPWESQDSTRKTKLMREEFNRRDREAERKQLEALDQEELEMVREEELAILRTKYAREKRNKRKRKASGGDLLDETEAGQESSSNLGEEDPVLEVQGESIPLSQVSQADVEQMSQVEFAVYSQLAEGSDCDDDMLIF